MLEKLKNRLEAFMPLEPAFWKEVLEYSKILTVKKNEILINYDSKSKDGYFILEGSFMVSQVQESGQSKAVWFHFDEIFDFMATPDSYFMDTPTKYELKALEDSKVVKLNKQRVDSWVQTYSCFNQIYIQSIITDFVTIYEARSSLLSLSALDFLKYTKENFPFIFEKLPSYYIADFIGVTPEWYSKLQKKL